MRLGFLGLDFKCFEIDFIDGKGWFKITDKGYLWFLGFVFIFLIGLLLLLRCLVIFLKFSVIVVRTEEGREILK